MQGLKSSRVRLRRSLSEPGVVVAPGAYDGFSARLVAQGGFAAVYLSGNGMSGSVLGQPDVGLMTLTDVAGVARHICACVDIPVIVDADTGYGNAINAFNTVRTLENAGVAAIQIEDQVTSKRCGHLPGLRDVVAYPEAVGKISAAAQARTDPDLVLIGRTDALAAHGLDEAIRRANAFLQAGADVAFVECQGRPEELSAIVDRVCGPVLVNMDEAGAAASFSVAELGSLGVKVAIYPGLLRYSACYAMRSALEILRRDGSTVPARERMFSFEEYNELLGIEAIKALEERFLHPPPDDQP